MKSFTKNEAVASAIESGATLDEIAAEAARQARHVGTIPFTNMIRALNMLPRLNTRDDWTRLAGALTARAQKRKAR
jgi:hypothetical protein